MDDYKPLMPQQILAADHNGMRVDYSGLLKQARRALSSEEPALAEMLRQLQDHLTELGQRWYAGDSAVVDELLQLYCIGKEAREAVKAAAPVATFQRSVRTFTAPLEKVPEPLRPDEPIENQRCALYFVNGWNACRANVLAQLEALPEVPPQTAQQAQPPSERAEPASIEPLRNALKQIAAWQPPRMECRGEIVSMGVAIGSNGERDYFRGIAQQALDAVPAPAQHAQVEKDAERHRAIGAAVERAGAELPDDWEIWISLGKEHGVVELVEPKGHTRGVEVADGRDMGREINAGIDAAIATAKGRA